MNLRLSNLAAFLAVVCGLLVVATPAQSAQSGLAYDEVTRFLIGQSAPQPGSFASDFQAAINAQRQASGGGTHGGLLGGILNAVDTAKSAMTLMQTGSASTEYYLSGWRRIDDVSAQTATISKPQQRQTIFLDLAKRTYQVSGPEYRFANETPPPYERMRNPSQQMNGPGTGRLVISVSVTPLGSMTIENVPTTGYRSSFSMTETQSTGSCVNGSFQVSWTEYLSPYAEPKVPGGGGVAYRRTSTDHPELFALKPGCRPTIVTQTSGA